MQISRKKIKGGFMEEELECCHDCECKATKNLKIGLGMALIGVSLVALSHFFLCSCKKCK